MAIEYVNQKQPYIMGNAILWMNNIYIGAFDDEQMLLPLANSLEQLQIRIFENRQFNNLSPDEIYFQLNQEIQVIW